MDMTSWHVGLVQEMVNDTCSGAWTFDMEADRLRRRVGEAGPKGSSASREGCGLAKAELRISVEVHGIGELLSLCNHNVPGPRTVVAQRSRT